MGSDCLGENWLIDIPGLISIGAPRGKISTSIVVCPKGEYHPPPCSQKAGIYHPGFCSWGTGFGDYYKLQNAMKVRGRVKIEPAFFIEWVNRGCGFPCIHSHQP